MMPMLYYYSLYDQSAEAILCVLWNSYDSLNSMKQFIYIYLPHSRYFLYFSLGYGLNSYNSIKSWKNSIWIFIIFEETKKY